MSRIMLVSKILNYVQTKVIYARKFDHIGSKTIIFRPLKLVETDSIFIGDKVTIAHYSWLMGNKEMGERTLSIGDRVSIGHFAHIIAKYNIVIEDNVLIADKVYITDCNHSYEDIGQPIIDQGIYNAGEVRIGEGSWLGENVCVIDAKIGKHCTIGANAVVTKDIPDYSVAVGIPARVIKKYNVNAGMWEVV
jgi:Acetyltransferase (isoleucine patch superfamily)